MTKEEARPNSVTKRNVVSRVSTFLIWRSGYLTALQPIPLPCLRLGAFDSPPEARKMRADDGRILESLRSYNVQLYPFTVYHGAEKARRYTLYANSESSRSKWYEKLVDAIGVSKARGEANMVRFFSGLAL
jgi:RHO1 GDP-GTP exchange protein 1/2